MSTEEQLISFFAYSFLIYPITNYLVSPQRKYKRVYGVLLAIAFLSGISYAHMLYETKEHGLNHYQTLGVNRLTPINDLKKKYRNISRELHPDRNKSPTASEDFGRVKHAFDVIVNPETRHVYDRLGDAGVKVAAQSVIDYKYMIIQMLVYYCSTSILAFFMTFSEPSGEALSVSFFGMSVMLLIEMAFVLENIQLPIWLLPSKTPYEIISTLHRLFPAFMSGCRTIIGAFHVDTKDIRIEFLNPVVSNMESISSNMLNVIHLQMENIENRLLLTQQQQQANSNTSTTTDKNKYSQGIMQTAVKSIENKVDPNIHNAITEKVKQLKNPESYKNRDSKNSSIGELLFNFLIYFMIRLMAVKFLASKTSTEVS